MTIVELGTYRSGIRLPESIGFIEEADHAEKNGPDVLCRVPPLTWKLSRLRVIYWGVQNGYAEVSILKL